MFKLDEDMRNLLKKTLESQNIDLLWVGNCKDFSILEIEIIHELRDITVNELIEKGFDEQDNINNLGKSLEELIDTLENWIP